MIAEPPPPMPEHGEHEQRDRGDEQPARGQDELVGAVGARPARGAGAAAGLEIGHMAERTGVDRGVPFRWDGAVPKFDAFGREIGEDTLSGLGGSDSAPQATPQPLPSESWSDAAAAATLGSPVEDRPDTPPAPPRRRRGAAGDVHRSPARSRARRSRASGGAAA